MGVNSLLSHEHPGAPAEHPGKKVSVPPTVAQVRASVTAYTNSRMVNGLFPFKCPKYGTEFKLALIKIHPIRKIDENHYFSCSDWTVKWITPGNKAKTVDLDFFLKRGGNNWKVTDVWLHKVDGKAMEKIYVCAKHPDIGTYFETKCPVDGTKLKKVK